MATFAKLDTNKKVIDTILISDDDSATESLGIAKCKELTGSNTSWVQYWQDGSQRTRAAVIGGYYDSDNDFFTLRKPYDSWVWNTSTNIWEPPTQSPAIITATPEQWVWQESSTSWVKTSIPEPKAIEGGSFSWNTTDAFWEWTETPVPVEEEE